MASGKRRRKGARLNKMQNANPALPFRHKDGDRRRRGGLTGDQAIADKKAIHRFEAEMLSAPPQEQ